jgi:lactate dehydrogenase-like 2-hydroxyacid dehydrogenase
VKLIGEAELKTMKPTSFIVNVARGGIVDEDALACALEEKWIAGHRADYSELVSRHFIDNLKRYINPLVGLIPRRLRRFRYGNLGGYLDACVEECH